MVVKKKREGLGLEMKTFVGRDGTSKGAFHVFMEVEAKEAARQCGAEDGNNTRSMWTSLWRK